MLLSRALVGASLLATAASCSPFDAAPDGSVSGADAGDAAAAADAFGGDAAGGDAGDAGAGCNERALELSGDAGQNVAVANEPSIDLADSFTVEAWIYPRAASGEMHIASHHDHNASQGWLLAVKAGRLELRIYGTIDGTSGEENAGVGATQPFVVDNHWAHVAGTFDGTKMRVYYDGVLKDETAVPGLVRKAYAGDLFIGRAAYDPTRFWFNGLIDEVHLSTVARYTGKTFTRPTQRFVRDGSTLALLHFDEMAGSIANDETGNHPGTLGAGAFAPARVSAPCIADR